MYLPSFVNRVLLSLLCCSLLGWITPTYAINDSKFSTEPVTHHGKRWRIGYLQGGDYNSYQKSLLVTIQGLMGLGWIEEQTIPEQSDPKATRELWQWMAKDLKSKYLEFVEDAYWSAEWDKKQRINNREQLLQRLNGRKDIDLMFAFGTWAGQDLANHEHNIPTIVASTTDPIAANIIKSVDDSGFDHIHAKVDPTRHEQQVRLFHQIIEFQTLGIAYEDSLEGRGFGAIDSVEKVAKALNFNIVRCYARFNNIEQTEAEKNLLNCYQELAEKSVDAVYMTRHPGSNENTMHQLLAPLMEKKLPTFSQSGAEDVKRGALLSIALSNFEHVGMFYAKTIARILNGAKPRELPQFFQNPPQIAINLETAQLIGYEPSLEILGAADEIYQHIQPPEQQASE